MATPALHDGRTQRLPPEGTDDYREIAKRIVDVQGQLTHDRRDVGQLEALLGGAKAAWIHNEDAIADLTHQLAHLKNTVAQHESALDVFTARLARLQPRT